MTEQSESSLPEESTVGAKPDEGAVTRFLYYTLSLPERTVRSTVSLAGGTLREATDLLVPRAFQNSRTYQVMVKQTLDFLVEDVGGVERETSEGKEESDQKIDNFVARKAVGNFVETASLLTFHVSPLTILAVMSDVAYGSTAYLRELSDELKTQGIIDEKSTISNADELLEAVAQASGETSRVFDTPPLSVDGLKETINQTKSAVSKMDPRKLLPQKELERMWLEMKDIAGKEDVSLLTVSGTMTMHALDKVANVGKGALTSIRVAGNMFDRHVIDHYQVALGEIRERGLFKTLRDASGPYIQSVWTNFSSEKETITEDVVSGRFFGRMFRKMGSWFRRSKQVEQSETESSDVAGGDSGTIGAEPERQTNPVRQTGKDIKSQVG
ncbi:MAG: hypothetical protein MPJ50_06185 [Pirellulales bacterium]|nr:hypothetical protein [Pirellulales bacterium]